MRDNLGNTDHEKKQDMQGKPVHGFFITCSVFSRPQR